MRVSSEAEKDEWMEKLKERATGSLANRRKQSAAAVGATGENSKVLRTYYATQFMCINSMLLIHTHTCLLRGIREIVIILRYAMYLGNSYSA